VIAGLPSVLLLLRPDAQGAEVLLAAGFLAAALAVLVLLRTASTPIGVLVRPVTAGFAELRVLLRCSDPSAPGHRRARAPGTTR
jgi:hypothetical protein